MRIQSLIKIGVCAGLIAYGYNACQDFNKKNEQDFIRARDNAKMFLKRSAPAKYDSLMNLGIGNSTKAADINTWLKTEVGVLDSLNQATINKAILNMKNTEKGTIKAVK